MTARSSIGEVSLVSGRSPIMEWVAYRRSRLPIAAVPVLADRIVARGP
jgi:hypothetical protein